MAKPINRFLLPLALVIVWLIATGAGMYAWFHHYNTCAVEEVEKASASLARQLDRYDHAYQFAATVTREGLDRPVLDLQQILLDTKDVTVPACMQTAQAALVEYMGTVIRAFRAYMAAEPDAAVRKLLDESAVHFNRFNTEREMIDACAPYCGPWNEWKWDLSAR